MITIATVGDFIRENYGLTAHCNVCRHSANVSLTGLSDRLGPDAIIMQKGQPSLKCAKCGSRDCSKIVVAPTAWSRT